MFILRPPLSQTRSSVSIPPTMEQIANLLDCISWSGVGPGLTDAATKVALQVGKPVGGVENCKWTMKFMDPNARI